MGAMSRHSPHFSRPVYEGLPWFYITCGVAALVASYLLASRGGLSLLTGVLGLMILVGGSSCCCGGAITARCARSTRNPDSLSGKDPP